MLALRLDSSTPLVDQIATGIRRAIAAGELAANDPLPTVRQLAAGLGINMNAVAQAYRALEAVGLVLTRPGYGRVGMQGALEYAGEGIYALRLNFWIGMAVFGARRSLEEAEPRDGCG